MQLSLRSHLREHVHGGGYRAGLNVLNGPEFLPTILRGPSTAVGLLRLRLFVCSLDNHRTT